MELVPDERKLGELLLYIAGKLLGDPRGGAVKTNKVLFASEFAHLRTYGLPITAVEYQKLKHGPAPRRLLPVRDGLIADGSAVAKRDRYMGYPLDRLVPQREPRMDLFTPEEIKIVDEVIDSLWNKTGAEASDESHHEMGWRMVSLGDTIPYEAAFLAPAFEVTDSMAAHARELAKQIGS